MAGIALQSAWCALQSAKQRLSGCVFLTNRLLYMSCTRTWHPPRCLMSSMCMRVQLRVLRVQLRVLAHYIFLPSCCKYSLHLIA